MARRLWSMELLILKVQVQKATVGAGVKQGSEEVAQYIL